MSPRPTALKYLGTRSSLGVLALALALWVGLIAKKPLFGDEALELLQFTEINLFQLYLMIPTFQADWAVNRLEPFYAYWVKLFYLLAPQHVETLSRVCLAVVHLINTLLVLAILRDLQNRKFAYVGALLYATSFYALSLNQFITRNAVSPLWTLLGIWALIRYFTCATQPGPPKRYYRYLGLTAVALAGHVFTYSSYKMYLPAFYLASLGCLFFAVPRSAFFHYGATVGTFALSFLGLLWASGDFKQIIFRGHYTFVKQAPFFQRLGDVLLWPMKYTSEARYFSVEQAHLMVAKAPLNLCFAAVFLFGFYSCARASWRLRFFPMALLLFKVLLMAIGPNLKFTYIAWPLVLIILSMGLFKLWAYLPNRRARVVFISAVMLLIFFDGYQFQRRMIHLAPSHPYLLWDKKAGDVARKANALEKEGKYVVVYTPYGRDVALWRRRQQNANAKVLFEPQSMYAYLQDVREHPAKDIYLVYSRGMPVPEAELQKLPTPRTLRLVPID